MSSEAVLRWLLTLCLYPALCCFRTWGCRHKHKTLLSEQDSGHLDNYKIYIFRLQGMQLRPTESCVR